MGGNSWMTAILFPTPAATRGQGSRRNWRDEAPASFSRSTRPFLWFRVTFLSVTSSQWPPAGEVHELVPAVEELLHVTYIVFLLIYTPLYILNPEP